MTPVRVAVTGPSGDVGHGIVCGLQECAIPLWLAGLDNSQSFAAQRMLDKSFRMFPVADENYIPALIQVLKEHQIEYLFCGIDSEVPLLAAHRKHIQSETGCNVIVADQELVERCADKLVTARWLSSLNIPTPETWNAEQLRETVDRQLSFSLPLIVKPRCGHNSIGVRMIHDRQTIDRELSRADETLCFQEYLPGNEYTCGLLFDHSGDLKDWIVTQRILSGGRTVVAETKNVPEIERLLHDFGAKIKAIGALNIQLRMSAAGQPSVFEINPRLSGSTLMRLDAGYNDPARILENLILKSPIEKTDSRHRRVLREWATVVEDTKTEINTDHRSHLVLDCGGTLLRLLPSPAAICQRVLHEMDFRIPFRTITQAISIAEFCMKRRSSRELGEADRVSFYIQFNGLLSDALGISSHRDEFHRRYYAACTHSLHWRPLPFATECVKQLAERFSIFVLANWDNRLAALLQKHGFADNLSGVVDSATLGCEKPDLRIFEEFSSHTGINADSCIYVGNEYEADIAGSRQAGFLPILLDTTQRYSPGVDCAYVTSWKQLTTALQS